MNKILCLIRRLFGKEQKRLLSPAVVFEYITIKPFYDRSDSYWQ